MFSGSGGPENTKGQVAIHYFRTTTRLHVPAHVCVDVVEGHDQQEQHHTKDVGEDRQLHVADHLGMLRGARKLIKTKFSTKLQQSLK